MKKLKFKDTNVRCPICNYCNHKEFLKRKGTCHLCETVLDKKANWDYHLARLGIAERKPYHPLHFGKRH